MPVSARFVTRATLAALVLSAGLLGLPATAAAARARERLGPDLATGGRLGQLRGAVPLPDGAAPAIPRSDVASRSPAGSVIDPP
jgi:hypothetical protein